MFHSEVITRKHESKFYDRTMSLRNTDLYYTYIQAQPMRHKNTINKKPFK